MTISNKIIETLRNNKKQVRARQKETISFGI